MGLDIGLERTGRFATVAAIELSPASCKSIAANRDAGRTAEPDMRIYEGDISTLDPYQVMADLGLKSGELDLLCGGPPCQSFSTAGRRGSVQDVRGTLIWQFLRFIVAFRPKFFLMENVRGLMSSALRHRPTAERPMDEEGYLLTDEERGSVVRSWLSDLREQAPEYRVDCFEVNAVNYGAPQLRERVLFIGNKLTHLVEFPNPTHGEANEEGGQLTLFDPPAHGKLTPFRTLGDAIRGITEDNPVLMDFSPRKKQFLALVKPGGNWRTLPEEIQRESMGKAWFAKGGRSGWWRRLSYDLPCPTLLTMPNHASSALCHPDEVRALTLREFSLIQEFPPEWEFFGSPQEQYAQAGNAVPVKLGEIAGEVLARHLDAAHAEGLKQRSFDHEPFRLTYVRSHVRTRMWFKDGHVLTWNDGQSNGEVKYNLPKTRRMVKDAFMADRTERN